MKLETIIEQINHFNNHNFEQIESYRENVKEAAEEEDDCQLCHWMSLVETRKNEVNKLNTILDMLSLYKQENCKDEETLIKENVQLKEQIAELQEDNEFWTDRAQIAEDYIKQFKELTESIY